MNLQQTYERQGHGKLTFADGKGWYEGSWESDLRHGRGKQMYPHGDLYDGGWELNKVEQVFGVWKKYVYLNAHMHAHAHVLLVYNAFPAAVLRCCLSTSSPA